jgi:biotin carboxyl carrier protein
VAAKHLPSLLARILLFTAGIFIAGWGASQVLSRVRSVVSSQAVVNGHIVTLTAADPGTVAIDQLLQSGMAVQINQVLLRLLNPKTDPWLRDAQMELALDRSRLSALMTQVHYQQKASFNPARSNSALRSPLGFSQNRFGPTSLIALEPIDEPPPPPPMLPDGTLTPGAVPTDILPPAFDLSAIDDGRQDPSQIDLSRIELGQIDRSLFSPGKQTAVRLAEETAKQTQIQVTLSEQEASLAEAKYRKLNQLGQAGAVGSLTVEEARRDWEMKLERVDGNRIEFQKKQIERDEQIRLAVVDWIERRREAQKKRRSLKALTRSAKLEPPIQAPVTPIAPTIVPPIPSPGATPFDFDLWRQAQELQTKIRSREAAIAKTQQDPRNRDRPIASPHDGVIWSVMARQGEAVTEAQPLVKILDCRQVWVDAFISIDDLPKIAIGQAAEVKLQGLNQGLPGLVRTARAYFLGPDNTIGGDTAIKPPALDQKQLAQIRVEFDRPDRLLNLDSSRSHFCYVGQIAEVRLPIAR